MLLLVRTPIPENFEIGEIGQPNCRCHTAGWQGAYLGTDGTGQLTVRLGEETHQTAISLDSGALLIEGNFIADTVRGKRNGATAVNPNVVLIDDDVVGNDAAGGKIGGTDFLDAVGKTLNWRICTANSAAAGGFSACRKGFSHRHQALACLRPYETMLMVQRALLKQTVLSSLP